jgi:Putative stress-induced transcription regulator
MYLNCDGGPAAVVPYFSAGRDTHPPQLRTAVDLTSYAELAVRLVNSAAGVDSETDQLGSIDAFRAFVGDYPHLRGPWTHHDLDALRMLRTELAGVFAAAAQRDHATAAERLNALLVQYPIRPTLVRHDRSRWHLHLDESGSLADRYAAGAIASVAAIAAQYGMSHLGICTIADCRAAFIDSSSRRSSLCCVKHSAGKANVTALRNHRRSANGYSAAG